MAYRITLRYGYEGTTYYKNGEKINPSSEEKLLQSIFPSDKIEHRRETISEDICIIEGKTKAEAEKAYYKITEALSKMKEYNKGFFF